MDVEYYLEELRQVRVLLVAKATTIKITGNGLGAFIAAEKGNHGIEIYKDEMGNVILDTSLNGELLGEKDCPNFESAIDSAERWLNGGEYL